MSSSVMYNFVLLSSKGYTSTDEIKICCVRHNSMIFMQGSHMNWHSRELPEKH